MGESSSSSEMRSLNLRENWEYTNAITWKTVNIILLPNYNPTDVRLDDIHAMSINILVRSFGLDIDGFISA